MSPIPADGESGRVLLGLATAGLRVDRLLAVGVFSDFSLRDLRDFSSANVCLFNLFLLFLIY
jgi:hypothetical protein